MKEIWERKRNKKLINSYAIAYHTVANLLLYCSILQKIWHLEHLINRVKWCLVWDMCQMLYLILIPNAIFGTYPTSTVGALNVVCVCVCFFFFDNMISTVGCECFLVRLGYSFIFLAGFILHYNISLYFIFKFYNNDMLFCLFENHGWRN